MGTAETKRGGGTWPCRDGAAPCLDPFMQNPTGAREGAKGTFLFLSITNMSHSAPPGCWGSPPFLISGGEDVGGRTAPQSRWPRRFPFLGIKHGVSPKTTTKIMMLELLLFFSFFCSFLGEFCSFSGGIWEVAAGSFAFNFAFSLFKVCCGD